MSTIETNLILAELRKIRAAIEKTHAPPAPPAPPAQKTVRAKRKVAKD